MKSVFYFRKLPNSFKSIELFFIVIFLSLLLTNCTTVKETIYLQGIEVNSPVSPTPINITDKENKTLILSPRFSIGTTNSVSGMIDGHTPVNASGIFQVDTVFNQSGGWTYTETQGANIYEYNSNNLKWNIPDFVIGLDADIKAFNNVALSGGFAFSQTKSKSLTTGRVGMGIFGSGAEIGLRFDAGLIWQQVAYDASTVVVRESSIINGNSVREVIFYRDIDKESNLNYYLSLTVNSIHKDWLLNWFLTAGYQNLNLVDFKPRDYDKYYYPFLPFSVPYDFVITEDLRGEANANVFNVSPGIYFNFTPNIRILLGSRVYFVSEIEDLSKGVFVVPMIQFDMGL
jgi:hypothetical protein